MITKRGWERPCRAMAMMWVLKDEKEVIRQGGHLGLGPHLCMEQHEQVPLVCALGSLFSEIKFNYQVCTIDVSLCQQFILTWWDLKTLRTQAPVLFYSKKIARAGHILPCLNSQIQEKSAGTMAPKGQSYDSLFRIIGLLNCTSGREGVVGLEGWVESLELPSSRASCYKVT